MFRVLMCNVDGQLEEMSTIDEATTIHEAVHEAMRTMWEEPGESTNNVIIADHRGIMLASITVVQVFPGGVDGIVEVYIPAPCGTFGRSTLERCRVTYGLNAKQQYNGTKIYSVPQPTSGDSQQQEIIRQVVRHIRHPAFVDGVVESVTEDAPAIPESKIRKVVTEEIGRLLD